MKNFCLAQEPSRGMIPNWETKQGTYSWKVEQQQENKEEDNLRLLLQPSLSSSTSNPCTKLQGCWAFLSQVAHFEPCCGASRHSPNNTHTGTRKWDLLKVNQDEYTPFGVQQKGQRSDTLGHTEMWVRDVNVCSSNLVIVWTVNHGESLVLFRGSSHINQNLGEIRAGSR